MDMKNDITIRIATPDDAKSLLEIYAPYILNTGVTFEYEVPTEDAFAERIRKICGKYPYLVACQGDTVIGYAYAKELGERAAFSHSVETALYIARDARGRGIGTLLYRELERLLRLQNVTNLYAAVSFRECEDETITHASPRFHIASGYHKAAHFNRCGYKFGRWYDIIWYEKYIGEHTENPDDFIKFNEIQTKMNNVQIRTRAKNRTKYRKGSDKYEYCQKQGPCEKRSREN